MSDETMLPLLKIVGYWRDCIEAKETIAYKQRFKSINPWMDCVEAVYMSGPSDQISTIMD